MQRRRFLQRGCHFVWPGWLQVAIIPACIVEMLLSTAKAQQSGWLHSVLDSTRNSSDGRPAERWHDGKQRHHLVPLYGAAGGRER